MAKTKDEIIQIVSYGGGVSIDGSAFSTDELVQIVSYAQEKSRVIIRNIGSKSTDDLINIASYGIGKVVLEL